MQEFLKATDVVDWHDAKIAKLAEDLANQSSDKVSLAHATFNWVRDNIEHSTDFDRCEVTCRASDVLAKGTGFCFAKSHLLAALLRARGIPAGFCYQRLSIDGSGPPYCLHGLNAVFLEDVGWYRVDARGNKDSVQAEFTPPKEQLAFELTAPGEADLLERWPDPLGVVVDLLTEYKSVEEVVRNLPDAPVIPRDGSAQYNAENGGSH